jgi:phosphoenolpyruvate-protein phosphotransferase/dihydroxyacetone kinase phosphotransfer subunit
MVGIVVVSHSHLLAQGLAELVHGLAGGEVPLAVTGGLDEPDHPLGTDAMAVLEAIEQVYSDDGVLVLMDLGSAVLSAEMAVGMLPERRRGRILLCEAPLVEGATAAVVQSRLGSSLEEVAAEARSALAAKAEHLGTPSPTFPEQEPSPPPPPAGPVGESFIELDITNPLGLHARPAVRFVQTVGRFQARVLVTNLTTGKGPAAGRSLNALATLGVRRGHRIAVEAQGPGADEVLVALRELAAEGFGEQAMPPGPPGGVVRPAVPVEGGWRGLSASPGIAIGEARHFRPPELEVPDRPASDPEAEWAALQDAISETRLEISASREAVRSRASDYEAAIFDAHLLFLEDEALLGPARRAILDEGRNGAAAWQQAVEEAAREFEALEDEYLRARVEDLRAVGRQVLLRLLGQDAARPLLVEPGILVARDLTPADTAALDPSLVRGIATAYGSATSHSAILARSLGVPAVVGLGDELMRLEEGALLIVDGEIGTVLPQPSPELVSEYQKRRREWEEARQAARAASGLPGVTRDGHRVEVAANLGSPGEADEAVAAGAEGVGLLRTEFLFLDRATMPDEEEQFRAYLEVAERMENRSVILRTLDVGGDKRLSYLPQAEEANPFLGRRGVRLTLSVPELLTTQLRAALRVAARHPLKLMFPMVTTLEEFRAAKLLAERAAEALRQEGVAVPDRPEVGVMVETPAVAVLADRFAPEVDFFSIGSNDLTQYTFAAERGNPWVAPLADHFHPGLLRLVRQVVQAAEAHGRWVGVCGEMAGDPRAAGLLVGLGVGELSMAPSSIPLVKAALRSMDYSALQHLAEKALDLESGEDVRELLVGSFGA